METSRYTTDSLVADKSITHSFHFAQRQIQLLDFSWTPSTNETEYQPANDF
jgi:hypothetical protein